ncbi:hypothetical protein BDY21DRAFT_293525 [Lineolata rhizophorae]|uniref:Uncharacterized protein n=1 Tax=Lineolata rhizophorae TaxID=578093 RepID=A0A6A6NN41_9PEZI|nr:hypothetical protein BDY21DRAFT_293525 [Lineolata rhizophorae]
MLEFLPDWTDLQLDIVGFLAILGEGSVLSNAQVATLSWLIFLPRLLPAPQALLRPSRPERLESTLGWATSVYAGNHRDYITHIGDVLIDGDAMPNFSVRCVEIEWVDREREVKAKRKSVLALLAVTGCAMAIALLVLSAVLNDGMALVATVTLSFLSTIVGLGNKWKLRLPQASKGTDLPKGDLVIRYPKGNFVIVKCKEDVARSLFFAPENIDYLVEDPAIYRLISLIGTMLLMVGVVCLANAQLKMQIAFAAAYMLLNAAYWIVAALPVRKLWDTDCFLIKPHAFAGSNDTKKSARKARNFTEALWLAILATKTVNWVRQSQAAPDTPSWRGWLSEAEQRARDAPTTLDGKTPVYENSDWDPHKTLQEYLKDGAVESA